MMDCSLSEVLVERIESWFYAEYRPLQMQQFFNRMTTHQKLAYRGTCCYTFGGLNKQMFGHCVFVTDTDTEKCDSTTVK